MYNQLWNEFSLGDDNFDVGGGLLYCLRYNQQELEHKREIIVNSLENLGLSIEERGTNNLAIKKSNNFYQNNSDKTYILIEELSTLNDAIEYSNSGFGNCNSMNDLRNILMSSYFNSLKKSDLVGAYDIVSLTIPMITKELSMAQKQNNVLNRNDKTNLESLIRFSENQKKFLNNPSGYVIFGLYD
jgi:hypothetical protein